MSVGEGRAPPAIGRAAAVLAIDYDDALRRDGESQRQRRESSTGRNRRRGDFLRAEAIMSAGAGHGLPIAWILLLILYAVAPRDRAREQSTAPANALGSDAKLIGRPRPAGNSCRVIGPFARRLAAA